MPNPYIQAALTCFRQPFASARQSLIILIVLFFLVLFFFVGGGRRENHHVFELRHLFLFIVLFAYWAIHLKEQFADSRASLMPGFRTVHGVVAVMVAIVFGVLLPGGMAPLIGWQSFGFVSITTLLFGAILWLILHPGGAFAFLIMAGCISILAEPIRSGIEQIVWGHRPVQAFICIGIGAAFGIAGMIRLLLLNEEMPEYHLKIQASRKGRTQLSDLQWRRVEKWYSRGWRNRLADKPIVNLIYHAQHAADSSWSRIRRWNVSNITIWSAGLVAIAFYLTFILLGYFTKVRMRMSLLVWMAIYISVSTVFGSLGGKNRSLSHELMMPISRDDYLTQLGMSAAISQLTMYGAFMATFILWMFTAPAKPDLELLAYIIAYSALIQIWTFGLAVWLLSFCSIIRMTIIIFLALIPTAVPITALDAQMPLQWRPLIPLFGGLLAGIGLLLIRRAYRRWLVADFD